MTVRFTTSLCLLVCHWALSQTPRAHMDSLAGQLALASKKMPVADIYIRTDKGIYETGENLWFSALVTSASDLSPFKGDGILYLQMAHKGTDSVVWQQMYGIKEGMANGSVVLDTELAMG